MMVSRNEIFGSIPEVRKGFFYDLGKKYLELAGKGREEIDEIFGRLGDYTFWDAQYSSPDGSDWGMDVMDAFRCLVDVHRTSLLLDGIQRTVATLDQGGQRNLTAIDAGTGTGILAIGLATAGCQKVYALEINSRTAEVAREFIDSLHLSDRIEVLHCDATQVELSGFNPGGVDILVSENLSTGLFDEPQFYIINHLSKYLSPRAKILPYKVTNFAYLGRADWGGIEKFTLPARMIKKFERCSVLVPYFELTSEPGMSVPFIQGEIDIEVDGDYPVNTLLVCSRFQIDEGVGAPVLEPDTADFLGKSGALRLPADVTPENGKVHLSLQYPTGMPRHLSVIDVEGNQVRLSSNKDWRRFDEYDARTIA